MTFRWIEDDRTLDDFLRTGHDGRFAIDTEFHRERTYYPQLALVQVRLGEQIGLVDPLRCDVSRLVALFDDDSTCVLHAGAQDLEILARVCGRLPGRVYDTQIAAGFLGSTQVSLASLVNDVRKVVLPKSDRLTDWLRRPLTQAQLDYAASDVEHLFEIHDHQAVHLTTLGRVDWVVEACAKLVQRASEGPNLDDAWMKVKDARSLRGEARGVARSLARWRERRAMHLDVPVRRVMSDMALVSIAQARPTSESALLGCRGVEGRQFGLDATAEILEAIKAGADEVFTTDESKRIDIDPRRRSAIPLIVAWVAERARQSELDPAFLATRHDIDEYLGGLPQARLRHGWRAELLLTDLDGLVDGSLALSVDDQGRLRLSPSAT
ncbi:MAG: ribonuclease D [Ilumatobacteraceae bacterium]